MLGRSMVRGALALSVAMSAMAVLGASASAQTPADACALLPPETVQEAFDLSSVETLGGSQGPISACQYRDPADVSFYITLRQQSSDDGGLGAKRACSKKAAAQRGSSVTKVKKAGKVACLLSADYVTSGEIPTDSPDATFTDVFVFYAYVGDADAGSDVSVSYSGKAAALESLKPKAVKKALISLGKQAAAAL